MIVRYQLSDQFIDQIFVSTGQKPDRFHSVELDVASLSPDDRQALVHIDFVDTATGGRFGQKNTLANIGISSSRVVHPFIQYEPVEFDDWLSPEAAVEFIHRMSQQKADCEAALPDMIAMREKQKKTEKEARAAIKRINEKEQKRRLEEKRAEIEAEIEFAANIEWDCEKATVDLYDRILKVSEIEQNSRFIGNWIKMITGIDTSKKDGYMYQGVFLRAGTIEIEKRPEIFLVSGASGSRKNNMTYYRVVVMKDGKLQATDIQDDRETPGWALRMRDRIAALLDEFEDMRASEWQTTLTPNIDHALSLAHDLKAALDDLPETAFNSQLETFIGKLWDEMNSR